MLAPRGRGARGSFCRAGGARAGGTRQVYSGADEAFMRAGEGGGKGRGAAVGSRRSSCQLFLPFVKLQGTQRANAGTRTDSLYPLVRNHRPRRSRKVPDRQGHLGSADCAIQERAREEHHDQAWLRQRQGALVCERGSKWKLTSRTCCRSTSARARIAHGQDATRVTALTRRTDRLARSPAAVAA